MNGNLTEAQHVGDSVKVSTPDFRTLVVIESVKETINQALIDMREKLLKELGRGRRPAKRTKGGKPTAPRIYGRDTEHGLPPKAIF